MAELTYREAVADGIAQEMARDERVVFLGEDVAGAGGVFNVVGLGDKAVGGRRERGRAALSAIGLAPPFQRTTVHLAPADLPKESGRFDLPIALGVLAASGQTPADEARGTSGRPSAGPAGRAAAAPARGRSSKRGSMPGSAARQRWRSGAGWPGWPGSPPPPGSPRWPASAGRTGRRCWRSCPPRSAGTGPTGCPSLIPIWRCRRTN